MNVAQYIEDNYNELCTFARRYTRYNIDLVNHVYLKCIDKEAEDAFMYLKTSFWREANCIGGANNFKNQYTYNSIDVKDRPAVNNIDYELIQKDRIDFHMMSFDEFDRELFRIYCEGYNMVKFSKESDIPISTINVSIKNTKDYLKKHL